MLDPAELYELADDLPALHEPVMLVHLAGFVDAGGAGRLVRDALLETLPHRELAVFDVDQVFDYRARRPLMLFVRDHWERYDAPRLALHHLTDAAGTDFLLLEGPEPDVQWERFIAAVQQLAQRFGVRLSVGVHGIPMAVPHSRPVGLTAHGTPPELVGEHEPWIDTVQVPGSAMNLLEFRLGEAGLPAMGFAAHVPHYVADAAYPVAAVALLEAVRAATGLQLPADGLVEAAQQTRASIDEQVAQSDEVQAVVAGLEQQYDLFVEARGRNLLDDGQQLPTGDELGAELERFLADEARRDGRDS